MKIIHCADLHLGSKLNSTYKDSDVAQAKLEELRLAFKAMADRARADGIKVIMLSGDVFDKDKPTQKDKALFYSIVEEYSDIDFLYLKGNHDSEISTEKTFDNLKTFTDEWTSYEYDDVVISGIELTKENKVNLYSKLSLDKSNINIVMMHGEESSTPGDCEVCIPKLTKKGINYLALGHIHKGYSKVVENEFELVYPGCLVGRGFDECGEKGYYILDIGKTINKEFVKASKSIIFDEEVDVTGTNSLKEIKDIIEKKLSATKNDIVRVTLVGNINFNDSSIATNLKTMISSSYKYFTVKDNTLPFIDFEKYKGKLSIRGQFVDRILSNEKYSDEEKKKLIALGLRVLEGRGIE